MLGSTTAAVGGSKIHPDRFSVLPRKKKKVDLVAKLKKLFPPMTPPPASTVAGKL